MIHQLIVEILNPYQKDIGEDYVHYKNHVHRVANMTLALKKEVAADDQFKIAIAAVFHDIGIWTEHTFDYLVPSMTLANNYLKHNGKEKWSEEISLIIDMHHKRTPYKGQFADNVESFRKADFIDLTKGLIRFDLSKNFLENNYAEFPMGRFRKIILKSFFKNLVKNPLRPLPMFKK